MKTPVSRVGNKTSILHILYAVFPQKYDRFIDVFGGSGSVLLGSPYPCNFEVYNDFDRNLVNLFRCMKERTMATIRELGFCNLNSREDFNALRDFFESEKFEDKYLGEEQLLTELILPPLEAEEMKEIRTRITKDYDVRRAAMFLKLLRYSYSSGGKSYASQPFDIRRLFDLIKQVESRMANVVVENQDFETLIKHYDRDGAFFYSGLFHDDGEYGRGDIRSCLDKGNRAIVYFVWLGFVHGGGSCGDFRFSRRVPKRKSEYKEYTAQYFKRFFRVFADRARADRTI